MSMGAFVYRMCEGKEKLTEEEAIARADSLAKQNGKRVHAYECYVCSPNWHIGHPRRGKNRAGRKRNRG